MTEVFALMFKPWFLAFTQVKKIVPLKSERRAA